MVKIPIAYFNVKGSLRKITDNKITKIIESDVNIGCPMFKFILDKTIP